MNTQYTHFIHLRKLVAASEYKTLSEAAGSLGLSPPAMTQGIKHLERELGVTLMSGTSRSRKLTPFGIAYARELYEPVKAVSRFRETARRLQRDFPSED